MAGGGVTTTWRTILKGRIIRKDENHWPGFQNWFQDASWGRALYAQSGGVCLAWVQHCLSPRQESCHYCAVPKPIVPIVPSRKMPKLFIYIHMPNQWTYQVNFFLQLGLKKVYKKQDHTWDQVGWEWTEIDDTACHPYGFQLLGSCQ